MNSPWALRLATILFIIVIVQASLALAVSIVGFAALMAVGRLLYRGRYLPGFIMDVLDRLSDKNALEQAYGDQARTVATIDAEDLARRLKMKVVGQDATIDRMAHQLRRRLAGRRPNMPIAVYCFAGPTGTGKSHLAKRLPIELFGDAKHLHRFDMSLYGQAYAATTLFGSPKAHAGSSTYGSLTAALRDVPDCVVLLDEIEKAHPDVHKRFLAAWNDGYVTEASDGANVPTDRAIFILTTNAASSRIAEIVRSHKGAVDDLDQILKSALRNAQWVPEVLSRIDEVFAFQELVGLDIARVTALEIERAAAQYGLSVAGGGIDPAILLEAMKSMERRMEGGARDIARAVEKRVTDGMIDARAAGAETVSVRKDSETGKVRIHFDGPKKVARATTATTN